MYTPLHNVLNDQDIKNEIICNKFFTKRTWCLNLKKKIKIILFQPIAITIFLFTFRFITIYYNSFTEQPIVILFQSHFNNQIHHCHPILLVHHFHHFHHFHLLHHFRFHLIYQFEIFSLQVNVLQFLFHCISCVSLIL